MRLLRVTMITLLMTVTIFLVSCRQESTSAGNPIVCTAHLQPGIYIEIYDRETGFPNSCGAVATIREGDYIAQLENPADGDCDDELTLAGAIERKGTYDITVRKTGYLDWVASNVVVTENVCHVNPITLQAYLEK